MGVPRLPKMDVPRLPPPSAPLIVDGHACIGDESGRVSIFDLSPQAPDGRSTPIAQIEMSSAIYSTPIVANNVLYLATKSELFAIQATPEDCGLSQPVPKANGLGVTAITP